MSQGGKKERKERQREDKPRTKTLKYKEPADGYRRGDGINTWWRFLGVHSLWGGGDLNQSDLRKYWVTILNTWN